MNKYYTKIKEAIDEGYSLEEIFQYLAERDKKVYQALQEGYSPKDIYDYFAGEHFKFPGKKLFTTEYWKQAGKEYLRDFLKIFEYLGRPQKAVANAIIKAQEGAGFKEVGEAMKSAITKGETFGGGVQILKNMGIDIEDPRLTPAQRAAAVFATSLYDALITDPLTWGWLALMKPSIAKSPTVREALRYYGTKAGRALRRLRAVTKKYTDLSTYPFGTEYKPEKFIKYHRWMAKIRAKTAMGQVRTETAWRKIFPGTEVPSKGVIEYLKVPRTELTLTMKEIQAMKPTKFLIGKLAWKTEPTPIKIELLREIVEPAATYTAVATWEGAPAKIAFQIVTQGSKILELAANPKYKVLGLGTGERIAVLKPEPPKKVVKPPKKKIVKPPEKKIKKVPQKAIKAGLKEVISGFKKGEIELLASGIVPKPLSAHIINKIGKVTDEEIIEAAKTITAPKAPKIPPVKKGVKYIPTGKSDLELMSKITGKDYSIYEKKGVPVNVLKEELYPAAKAIKPKSPLYKDAQLYVKSLELKFPELRKEAPITGTLAEAKKSTIQGIKRVPKTDRAVIYYRKDGILKTVTTKYTTAQKALMEQGPEYERVHTYAELKTAKIIKTEQPGFLKPYKQIDVFYETPEGKKRVVRMMEKDLEKVLVPKKVPPELKDAAIIARKAKTFEEFRTSAPKGVAGIIDKLRFKTDVAREAGVSYLETFYHYVKGKTDKEIVKIGEKREAEAFKKTIEAVRKPSTLEEEQEINRLVDKMYREWQAEHTPPTGLQIATPKVPIAAPHTLSDFWDAIVRPTKSSVRGILNVFQRFVHNYPKLIKEHPQIAEDLRIGKDIILPEARTTVNKIYTIIWGDCNRREIQYSTYLIYMKDEIGRTKAGKLTYSSFIARQILGEKATGDEIIAEGVRLAEEQLKLFEELIKTDKKVDWNTIQKAVNQYKKISEMFRDDLIKRGRLKEDQLIEDYAPHFVEPYWKPWMTAIRFPSRSLTKPFAKYLIRAPGTIKPIIKSHQMLLKHFGDVVADNLFEDWADEIFTKYNKLPEIYQKVSFDKLAKIFGTDKTGKRLLKPKHGRIYNIEGKDYMGWVYDRRWFRLAGTNLVARRVRRAYLIPYELSDIFQNLMVRTGFHPILRALNMITGTWKMVVLKSIMLPYNVVNLFGDSFLLYLQYPQAFGNVPWAINFLATKPTQYNATQKEVASFIDKYDILGAGFAGWKEYAGELLGTPHLAKLNMVEQYREALLRVALAKWLLDYYKTNKRIPETIWNVQNLDDMSALGLIARRTLIDYGDASDTFRRYIRGFLLPFASFYTKVPVILGRMIWKRPWSFIAKVLLPMMGATIYNHIKNRKIEKRLPWWFKNRFHIILRAEDKDGDGIPDFALIWSPQLPVDVAPVFGQLIEPIMNAAMEVARGQTDVKTAARELIRQYGLAQYRSAVYLISPFIRVIWGLIKNRDPLFNRQIVPDEIRGSKTAFAIQTRYILETLIPMFGQYGQMIRTGRISDNPLVSWLKDSPFNVKRAFGFYTVDLNRTDIMEDFQTIAEARGNWGLLRYHVVDAFVRLHRPRQSLYQTIQKILADKDVQTAIKVTEVDLSPGQVARWLMNNNSAWRLWALHMKGIADTKEEKIQWQLMANKFQKKSVDVARRRLPRLIRWKMQK